MPWMLYSGWIAIALLILTFIIARSGPILFAIVGQIIIFFFWLLTIGATLADDAEKHFLLLGLEFLWAGLLIIRIMLKRSVSLQLLAQEDFWQHHNDSSLWIAARLEDAIRYDLVRFSDERYALTRKGRIMATLIKSLHWILPD